MLLSLQICKTKNRFIFAHSIRNSLPASLAFKHHFSSFCCSNKSNEYILHQFSAMKDVRSNVIYVFLGICGMLHSSFCSSQVLAWIWPSSKGPFSALCYTYCPNWSDGKCLLHCGIGSGEIFGCLLSILAKKVSTWKMAKYNVFQMKCFAGVGNVEDDMI